MILGNVDQLLSLVPDAYFLPKPEALAAAYTQDQILTRERANRQTNFIKFLKTPVDCQARNLKGPVRFDKLGLVNACQRPSRNWGELDARGQEV